MITTSKCESSHKPEILAPAGGLDAAYAAFSQGADAVYLGLNRFSARAEAVNFTPEEVEEITGFAHAQTPRRRIFVTLNTIFSQGELRPLLDTVDLLAGLGVDALITQDLGLAALVRRHWPRLELHASTQMAVHSLEGARELRRLGFARVTLARELTLEEIRAISAGGGLETEVFVHGALCYGYSGLCLLSSHRCGRSGNRGRCAYSCRDRLRIVSGGPPKAPAEAFPFSMKDLAVPDRLNALREASVACWKIEGRMKAPLYVAAVTDFYRRLRDGDGLGTPAARRDAEARLKSIFSRPWTELFLAARRQPGTVDPERVGHRGVPVGTALAVQRTREGAILRLRLDQPVERHDGLQVEPTGADRPFGFAVDPLRLVPRNGGPARDAFQAPAGATIEVPLPPDAPAIPAGATLFLSSSQAVRRAYPWTRPRPDDFRQHHPISVQLTATPDRLQARAALTGAGGATAEAGLEGPFETARKPGALAEAAKSVFERLGDTPFALAGLQVEDPAGVFVPVSRLNAVRRELATALHHAFDAARDRQRQAVAASETDILAEPPPPVTTSQAPAPSPRWSVLADDVTVLLAFPTTGPDAPNELQVPLAAFTTEALARVVTRFGANRVRAVLPPVARAWDTPALRDRLGAAKSLGIRRWLVANVASFELLRENDILGTAGPDAPDLLADWTLPVTNLAAARALAAMGAAAVTLAPEDGRDNLVRLLAALQGRAEVIAYQDTPLLISESCVYANLAGACPGPDRCEFRGMTLEHPRNGQFLARPEGCRTVVVSETPFCLAGRLRELAAAGATRFRAEFAHRAYTPESALATWRALRADHALPRTHAGNYLRGLQ